MFKFIFAEHKIHPEIDELYKSWYLLIDTQVRFNDFIFEREKQLLDDYVHVKKVVHMDESKAAHFISMTQIAMKMTLSNTKNRNTLEDDVDVVMSMYLSAYKDIFYQDGKLLVNKVLGCRGWDDSFKILQSYESKELIFPDYTEKDIRITCWPGGKHYYAKIGALEVKDSNRRIKWNTYEFAKDQALEMLKELNKNSVNT